MTHMVKARDERGVVSIMTVMFFIVLLSVLVVAFLRIMSDEQEQVIGDDLTKGALASAQSGVEDAKRALLFCRTATGADKTNCESELAATTCPGIFGGASSTLRSRLGIALSGDGTVRVGGDTTFNQRYTCLLVKRQTNDVKGVTRPDEGFANMIELGTNGVSFNSIKLSWHRNGDKYDGATVAIPTTTSVDNENPQQTSWRGPSPTFTPYPAMLRIQLLEYDPAATIDQLSQRQLTYFLMPASGASSSFSVSGPINNTLVAQSGSALKRLSSCTSALSEEYACSMTLQNITGIAPAAGKRYFLRVSSVYRTTNYKIELLNGIAPVQFYDVQPEIDSTGVADNTYRRVLTRVEYGQGGYYPDNGVMTGDMLCKGFYVTASGNGGTTGGTNCTNGLASP